MVTRGSLAVRDEGQWSVISEDVQVTEWPRFEVGRRAAFFFKVILELEKEIQGGMSVTDTDIYNDYVVKEVRKRGRHMGK